MRRLPIYLLVDCSAGMAGEPFQAVRKAVWQILSDLKGDPMALEMAFLSVIVFNDSAKQVCPLTELLSFSAKVAPPRGNASLGAALGLLDTCLAKEVVRATPTTKGDYKPVVFLLSNGRPTDEWGLPLDRLKKRRVNLVAIAPTAAADLALLERITETVVEFKDMTREMFRDFMKVCSDKVGSTKLGDSKPDGQEKGSLPPPPPGSGINIVL